MKNFTLTTLLVMTVFSLSSCEQENKIQSKNTSSKDQQRVTQKENQKQVVKLSKNEKLTIHKLNLVNLENKKFSIFSLARRISLAKEEYNPKDNLLSLMDRYYLTKCESGICKLKARTVK